MKELLTKIILTDAIVFAVALSLSKGALSASETEIYNRKQLFKFKKNHGQDCIVVYAYLNYFNSCINMVSVKESI